MFAHIFALEEQLEVMAEGHNESGASQEVQTTVQEDILLPEIETSQEQEIHSKIPLVQVTV
ncbi:hypothetical protein D3C73_1440290 [compost metagenome]